MSRLSSLCGKLKEDVTLSNGDVIELKAPKVEDLAELVPLFNSENKEGKMTSEQLTKTTNVLKKMLKRSIPDATEEELDEVVLLELNTLMTGMTSLLNKAFGGNQVAPKN